MPLGRTKSKTDYGEAFTNDFDAVQDEQDDFYQPPPELSAEGLDTKSAEFLIPPEVVVDGVEFEFADPEVEVEGNGESNAKEEDDFDAGRYGRLPGSETQSTGRGLS